MLLNLFVLFFKIGLISFGGGYAIVSALGEQLVSAGLVGYAEYWNMVTVAQMTPGPIAVNIATYAGVKAMSGSGVYMQIIGGIVATLGVFLPSLIIVTIVAKIYMKFKKSSYVSYALSGIKPVVVGLMIASALNFILSSFFYVSYEQSTNFLEFLKGANILAVLIGVISFIAVEKFKIGTYTLVIACAILGILIL